MGAVARRRFLALCGAMDAPARGLSAPRSLQPPPRIGIAWIAAENVIAPLHDAIRSGLRDVGYVERSTAVVEARFGEDVSALRLHLDGCPHACGQHWVGDLGLQGTTARDERGRRLPAYDVLLRGALGPRAAIARPVFRRVPSEDLDEVVAGLVGGWLQRRRAGETFRDFCDRTSDEELGELAGREPARRKEAA